MAGRLARPKNVIASRRNKMFVNELPYLINGFIFEMNGELMAGFLENMVLRGIDPARVEVWDDLNGNLNCFKLKSSLAG